MKLADLYDCITAIYRAGWDDALNGRCFDPLGQVGENGVAVPQNAPQGKCEYALCDDYYAPIDDCGSCGYLRK